MQHIVPFPIVSPIVTYHGYEEVNRFTVAQVWDDKVVLFTRKHARKKPAVAAKRSRIAAGGVRMATFKEFERLVREMSIRVGVDLQPLDGLDLSSIEGTVTLR